MEHYLQKVHALYAANSSAELAAPMEKYIRNQFAFYGIKSPQRKELSKQIIAENGIPESADLKQLVKLCFQAEQREIQYFANDILEKVVKKMDDSWLETLEWCILQKSFWDTVDFLAPNYVGRIFMRYPQHILPYTNKWIESDNFWLQRSAIICQLRFRLNTDYELLFALIERRADSKEFFVRKASGWALREYGKFNPSVVKNFVENTTLSPLTKREALRRMD